MTGDPELEAMNTVLMALEKLQDQEAKTRVITYVTSRLKLTSAVPRSLERRVVEPNKQTDFNEETDIGKSKR
jgi:hypothetical protein